ncbi:hypothetical protein ACF082_34060 [Streptomyces lydicus]|uniref:hypothetical protein n=1 Tax=Streptomyces lydicus TaxID=47763 RepID=UPI0036F9C972
MRDSSPSALAQLEQDRALAQFLRDRLTDVETTGCAAERRALAGLREVLVEFEEKHPLAARMPADDFFVAQIDTLRWVLRCTATSAFLQHPDFQSDFYVAPTMPTSSESRL